MNELHISEEYLTQASCWVKGNCTWIFFTAFSLYKPQICCWVTQPLPPFLWDQAVKQGEAKQCRGCCGLQTAGTVLTIPLAPVGGRQHCWLNKQGHHPALTAVMNGERIQSATSSRGGQVAIHFVYFFVCSGVRSKEEPADIKIIILLLSEENWCCFGSTVICKSFIGFDFAAFLQMAMLSWFEIVL